MNESSCEVYMCIYVMSETDCRWLWKFSTGDLRGPDG